jgi:pimeloyl-ACP methyl ester carboxylesterase
MVGWQLAALTWFAAAFSGAGLLHPRSRLPSRASASLSAGGSLSRSLYALGQPLSTGVLSTAEGGYEICYEEHGKQAGAPALFLHGGPGAGCSRRHAGFFDPAHYRIILHDQRGCGKSSPRGSTVANETPFLIADIEALRVRLGIHKWACVLGGSWGTTLALEYAQAHPERVSSLVLRAVGYCPDPRAHLQRRRAVSQRFSEGRPKDTHLFLQYHSGSPPPPLRYA